jgi:hypothetical protein
LSKSSSPSTKRITPFTLKSFDFFPSRTGIGIALRRAPLIAVGFDEGAHMLHVNRWLWVGLGGAGFVASIIAPAFASIPRHVTNDTALYQNLSEIRAQKTRDLNFDADVGRLASLEWQYKENLAGRSRMNSALSRIQKAKYRSSRR